MSTCLQILEAFLWFVLITLLNVTLIILTLSVSRLLNLLLRLVAFLLFLNPQCLASISRWITASSSWKRFCLNFLDESPERKTSFIEISRGGKLPYKTGSPAISVQVKAPLALRYCISLVAVGGKRTSARVNIVPCSGTKKRGTECL